MNYNHALSYCTVSAILVIVGLSFAPVWVLYSVIAIVGTLMFVGLVFSFRDALRTVDESERQREQEQASVEHIYGGGGRG